MFWSVRLLRALVDMFVGDAESRLAALRETLEKGDAGGFERTAHTLKGSASNMGALRMSALAADLQKIGVSGNLTGAEKTLERLEEEYNRVRPALEKFMEGT